jgi:hypothetical protein
LRERADRQASAAAELDEETRLLQAEYDHLKEELRSGRKLTNKERARVRALMAELGIGIFKETTDEEVEDVFFKEELPKQMARSEAVKGDRAVAEKNMLRANEAETSSVREESLFISTKALASKKKPSAEFTVEYKDLTAEQKQKFIDKAKEINDAAAAAAAAAAANEENDTFEDAVSE